MLAKVTTSSASVGLIFPVSVVEHLGLKTIPQYPRKYNMTALLRLSRPARHNRIRMSDRRGL